MDCKFCGESLEKHHVFLNGLVICPEAYISYSKQLRSCNSSEDLRRFIDYWKYLCEDIDEEYNFDLVKKILTGKLSYLTDNYIIPANSGDKEKQKYVSLLYPRMLIVLECASNGNWVGDKEQKFKSDNVFRTF